MSQGAIVNPNRAIPRFRLNNVTPFTYRDGLTFLELIEELREWATSVFPKEIEGIIEVLVDELEGAGEQYEAGVDEFQRIHDAFMADVNASLMALNDSAISDLLDDPESLTRTKLDSVTEDVVGPIRPENGQRAVSKGELSGAIGDLLDDPESLPRIKLDSVTEDLLDDPESLTRIKLDGVTEDVVGPIRPENGQRAVGKGELVVNVRDHGAIGDGETDDVAAISSALAGVAEGGTVLFPPGVYRVGTVPEDFYSPRTIFMVDKPVTLRGDGATLRDTAYSVNDREVFHVASSNVSFENLSFINDVDSNLGRPVHRPIGVGSVGENVQTEHIRNVTVSGCRFDQAFYAIDVRSLNGYSIRDVEVLNNTVHGIIGENCGGLLVHCGDSAPLGNISNVVFSGNRVYDVNTAAGIGVFGAHHVTVTGNILDGSGAIGAGIQTERRAFNVSITGNTLRNHRQAIWVHDSSNVTVEGNTIHHDAATTVHHGIRVTVQGVPAIDVAYKCKSISITGNSLDGVGISVERFSTPASEDIAIIGLVISGNTIRIDDKVSGVRDGIYITYAAHDPVVIGNIISGGSRSSIMISGRADQENRPSAVVVGNQTSGVGLGLLYFNASSIIRCYVSGNVFHNGVDETKAYVSTVGDRSLYTFSSPVQAPEGSIGMSRDGVVYKKAGPKLADWTAI